MNEVFIELAVELLAFIGFGVIGSILGFLGYSMETLGITNLISGDLVIGVWYLVMGSTALFVAVYLIGVRELPSRFRSIRARLDH